MATIPNDPLAGLTPKQIWHDCIWISNEPMSVKIMLLCVGRFFDENCRSSSMSYAQIAVECGMAHSTAIRAAKAVRERWLNVVVGGGYQTRYGRQNLYHGILSPALVAELRMRKLRSTGCHGATPWGVTVTDLLTKGLATDKIDNHRGQGSSRGGYNQARGGTTPAQPAAPHGNRPFAYADGGVS